MKMFGILLAALFLNCSVHANGSPTYSEAVRAGDFLFVSGQFPLDPVTGEMAIGDMETLTNLALDHMQHVLHVKGFKMLDVVKTEVYLRDIRDYDAMDHAYGERFTTDFPPARDVIVAETLLNNARIEISCVACKCRH